MHSRSWWVASLLVVCLLTMVAAVPTMANIDPWVMELGATADVLSNRLAASSVSQNFTNPLLVVFPGAGSELEQIVLDKQSWTHNNLGTGTVPPWVAVVNSQSYVNFSVGGKTVSYVQPAATIRRYNAQLPTIKDHAFTPSIGAS